MNCKEFRNQITATVDGCLAESVRGEFREHLLRCPPCALALGLELQTKRLVRRHLTKVKAPGSVAVAVLDRLQTEDTLSARRLTDRRGFFRPATFVGIGVSCALGLVLFLLFLPSSDTRFPSASGEHTSLDDIIAQSRTASSATLHEGAASQDLNHAFAGRTDFPVILPALLHTKGVRGALDQHAGTTMAHLEYDHPQGPISVYEVCWECIQAGHGVVLDSDLLAELKSGGRSVIQEREDITRILWTDGRTLCIAESAMPKESLLTVLASRSIDIFRASR